MDAFIVGLIWAAKAAAVVAAVVFYFWCIHKFGVFTEIGEWDDDDAVDEHEKLHLPSEHK